MNIIDSILKIKDRILPRSPIEDVIDFISRSFGEQCFHICMMGPTRVGKTTLLASILNDFTDKSSQYYTKQEKLLMVEPMGDTYGRIADRINTLQMATSEGCFAADCLAGTQTHEIFQIGISYQKPTQTITKPDMKLEFHDFPGGWINSPQQLLDTKFEESEIMLLPIDASLIMEAVQSSQKIKAAEFLSIEQVRNAVKKWAHHRKENGGKGLLLFVPLKCETYFTDAQQLGFRKDQSKLLYQKVFSEDYFGSILKEVRSICGTLDIYYVPVDTIGCCWLSNKQWDSEGLKATYTIPPGAIWQPYGPAHIMLTILEYITERYEENKSQIASLLTYTGIFTDLFNESKKLTDYCRTQVKFGRMKREQ